MYAGLKEPKGHTKVIKDIFKIFYFLTSGRQTHLFLLNLFFSVSDLQLYLSKFLRQTKNELSHF